MKLLSFLLFLAALLGLSASAHTVSFADLSGQIAIPAVICGRSTQVVLDTGAAVGFAGQPYPGGRILGDAPLPTLSGGLEGQWEVCTVEVAGLSAQVSGIVSPAYRYLPLIGTPALQKLARVMVVIWPLREVVLLGSSS
jgi:hypothetical protein